MIKLELKLAGTIFDRNLERWSDDLFDFRQYARFEICPL